MTEEIKGIYEMLYSQIVTPFNLLDNVRLPNYSYVKYYKGEHGLIAEIKCVVEGDGDAIFYYHFDSDDKLNIIIKKTGTNSETVFDREAELQKALYRYNTKKSKKKKVAI